MGVWSVCFVCVYGIFPKDYCKYSRLISNIYKCGYEVDLTHTFTYTNYVNFNFDFIHSLLSILLVFILLCFLVLFLNHCVPFFLFFCLLRLLALHPPFGGCVCFCLSSVNKIKQKYIYSKHGNFAHVY